MEDKPNVIFSMELRAHILPPIPNKPSEIIMDRMYQLIDIEHNNEIGVITEDQVQFLIDNLEEEGVEDQDYYIDPEFLSFLAENSCDEELLTILTDALEGRVNIDVRYEVIK